MIKNQKKNTFIRMFVLACCEKWTRKELESIIRNWIRNSKLRQIGWIYEVLINTNLNLIMCLKYFKITAEQINFKRLKPQEGCRHNMCILHFQISSDWLKK